MTNLTDSESEQFLSQVERVRIEIKDKFSKSHQLLHEREAALLLELDQLVASYRGEEIRKQIQLISSSKESIISALKKNENYEALQLSIAPLNARIRELEVSLGTTETRMRGVELEWDGELQGRLKETGRIRIIGQFDYKKKDTSLQEQPVTLIWKKQLTTIETKITYFDSLNGAIQLNLDKLNNSFTSSAYLTPGNHNGILTLSDSDYNGETEPFHVPEKSDVVQEFTLSLVNIPNPGDGMKSSSVKELKEGDTVKTMKSRLKDFEERVKSLEQRCDHLFKENEKLKKEKDQRSKDSKCMNSQHANLMSTVKGLEVEKERISSDKNIALLERSRFKKELEDLKEQLVKSRAKGNIQHIDFNDLKESDITAFWDHLDSTKETKDKMLTNYFNSDKAIKIDELKKELSDLKSECGEAKVRSEEIIEYLHDENTRLESDLEETREALSKLKKAIYYIQNPLPLPSRSSALSRPQRASRQDPVYGPFFIANENKCEILVLPLSYLDPKRYEKSIV